jgi:hypothetical protein
MNLASELVLRALLLGVGATAVMDICALAAQRLFGIPMSDWGMVGRWVGHFPQGRFRHDSIAKAAPVRGELVIGWVTHYATGIAYAALSFLVYGLEWARAPTLGRAVLIGVAMIVAPFFLMQPGMGAGIAASKTPKPGAARLRSLMNHVAFGLGLYLAGAVVAAVMPTAT